MPIAKTYKRYAALSTFGVVGSPKSNVILMHNVQLWKNLLPGTYCVCAALENVIIWDMRKSEKVRLRLYNLVFFFLNSYPANFCLFKVNNRNFRKRCKICPNLTIKTPERRQRRFV